MWVLKRYYPVHYPIRDLLIINGFWSVSSVSEKSGGAIAPPAPQVPTPLFMLNFCGYHKTARTAIVFSLKTLVA